MASSKSSVDEEILNIVGTFGVSKKDAGIIYKEMCKIHKKHGRLDRELVLAAARPKGSKLHKFFEWDDTLPQTTGVFVRQANSLVRVKS